LLVRQNSTGNKDLLLKRSLFWNW